MGYNFARIVTAILLLWALDNHSYDYYTLLRFVVSSVSSFSLYFALKLKKDGWAWIFGVITILFNPILPVHLNRNTWAVIDVAVAVVLIASLFLLGPKPKDESNEKNSSII
ncbi:MAG: DUF6804 family protein [Ignavibacteria bacterium]